MYTCIIFLSFHLCPLQSSQLIFQFKIERGKPFCQNIFDGNLFPLTLSSTVLTHQTSSQIPFRYHSVLNMSTYICIDNSAKRDKNMLRKLYFGLPVFFGRIQIMFCSNNLSITVLQWLLTLTFVLLMLKPTSFFIQPFVLRFKHFSEDIQDI